MLAARHLVHGHSRGQDEDVVRARFDLHAVGVAHPEPFLGDLGHLVPVRLDGVFMEIRTGGFRSPLGRMKLNEKRRQAEMRSRPE